MKPVTRRDNIFIEKLADETILYDKANHRAHCLNASVAAVWENADGSRTVDDLAHVVAGNLSLPEGRALVFLALAELEQAGLLTTPATQVSEKQPISRRELTLKLATAGVSASLIPVVASVLAPTPAMAASAQTSYSIQWYSNELKTVTGDIDRHIDTFNHSRVAQQDFNSAVASGTDGFRDTFLGNDAAAQRAFQASAEDFDGVLKALGLPPL